MVHDEREYMTTEEQTPARKAFRIEESLYGLFIVVLVTEISKVKRYKIQVKLTLDVYGSTKTSNLIF